MIKKLIFTAYNRPEYLQKSVESWNAVRNVGAWQPVSFFIEPSEVEDEIADIALSLNAEVSLYHNAEKQGVLVNPWNAINSTFEAGADFVILAEDDVIVSTDVLEYFEWTSEEYATANSVLAINAFSTVGGGKSNQIVRSNKFSPLIWGVWKDRWEDILRDSWDKDYSSGNPDGSEAGWDWNINRIIKDNSLQIVKPVQSRSTHIGLFGTHMTPDQFESSVGVDFESTRGRQRYNEI